MKKLIVILFILSSMIIFFSCGEPEESVRHYVTLSQGEEFDFQLNPTSKWDTISYDSFGGAEPEHSEDYAIYIKEGTPPYYHFLYVASNDYVGEDQARIKLSRREDSEKFIHYFYITIEADLP